jgi:hypothetical protein
LNFPYKIAAKIPKIANYFQTKNKFDENSTFNSLNAGIDLQGHNSGILKMQIGLEILSGLTDQTL